MKKAVARQPFFLLLCKLLQRSNLLCPASLVGGLKDEWNVVKACITSYVAEWSDTQKTLSHRRVTIHSATNSLHRIVQVHTLQIFEANLTLKLCKNLLAPLVSREVVACGKGVAGVKTHTHSRLILHAVNDIRQVPKGISKV